jgi:uncharacterized damage-inducible protein DinB
MNITDLLLPEFDAETANTRKMLERVPDNKFDWKPHEKSMPMGRLATHLGEIPGWVIETINRRELDLAPPGQPPFEPTKAKTRQDVLNLFDRNVVNARAALVATDNEHLMQNWSLLMGGKTILSMPRTAVLRNFVMNHMIHHRAQLGVYLRLNNIPVPATYGPSADEGNM